MLRAQIHVDLPSEERQRDKTLIEWLKQSLGKTPDLRTGREALSISCIEVVEAVMVCFYRVGIHNLLSLVVDGQTLFVDPEREDQDAQAARAAAREHAKAHEKFGVMHMVAEHSFAGLHLVITIVVRSEVRLGDKEMQITLSARPEALRHQEGESAEAYAARLVEYAHSNELEGAIAEVNRFASQLGREFQVQVGMYSVSQGQTQAMLVRPSRESVADFEGLDFSSISEATYRPIARSPHPDAYYQHFQDPLYDFQNFVLIAEVVESHVWALAELLLVESQGQVLATGDDLDDEGAMLGWPHYPRLRFQDARPRLEPS